MKSKYFKIVFKFWLLAFALWPNLALAANKALDKLEEVGVTSGPYAATNDRTTSQIVGVIIQAALSIVGVIFLALMIYAGYNWMTARGEEEKVEKAKDTIIRAFIGLIIVVGAYAIWRFVFSYLIS